MPLAERGGIPHHLIDVADPLEEYSAARYAREAAAAIRDITARGRLPILVGGTGLYYRALIRGFFPGPSRDTRAARTARADRRSQGARVPAPLAAASRSTVGGAHSAPRSQAADPRARGLSSDRPALTEHFADTQSPLPDYEIDRLCAADSRRRHRGARRASRRRAVPPGADGRSARAARRGRAARPHTRSPGSSTGRRSSCSRRARRGGDARIDRQREPAICASAVDLVQERA